ncbi:hypothetical protein [Abyssalbus ytuae]|uniref:Uncharacterized protein n=1 Tax=Abyssalbus ytuae TaxID=2926907 RepID=A0A9E6ZJE6_9FLAO|nr:hypothetical protein [Abyssalbus ytuae]UOB16664.1 hypothetical protein MQE35_13070 [Abyssalbus ytuae]
MKTLVNILSFVLIIICIGFSDFFSSETGQHNSNTKEKQIVNADTTFTQQMNKLKYLCQNKFWYPERTNDSGTGKNPSLLLKQIIENNFSMRGRSDSVDFDCLKDSLTCKN